MEINGKLSSTKRTKHIKAKFFFVKDKVDKGEVKITDCPTQVMWADGNSKPLQGTLFKVMRDKLMNCGVNRIPGTVVDIRPLKSQASLRARDLARYRELVGVGHRFGKVSVLAIMPSKIYPGKLEWTSNADRLKLNGWFTKPNKILICPAIVAFVHS